MPQISVIVPVYNAEKSLSRCIDSILKQTFTDFELLLVNDGSKDRSGEICDKYAASDSRVRVFHKENGGVSSARNVGLNNAKGEWVTFCDADDWTYDCWLKNFAENFSNDYQLIVQGFEADCLIADGDKSIIYGFDYKGPVKDGLILLNNNNIIGYLWVKAFKNEIINSYDIRFNEELRFTEDVHFVLEYLFKTESMFSVKSVGYYYYMPDWSVKYKEQEFNQSTFDHLCKTTILSTGIGDNMFRVYMTWITNILFDSYVKRYHNRKKLLKSYCKVVRGHNNDRVMLWDSRYKILSRFIRLRMNLFLMSLLLDIFSSFRLKFAK